MTAIDLTHPLYAGMPVYPGTTQPELTREKTVEDSGFQETRISCSSHTGTHIDAPAHILLGAKTLDQLPIDQFSGPTLLVDVSHVSCGKIGIETFTPYAESLGDVAFLLLFTGWSRYWGTDKYFRDFPVLSPDCAQWLSGFKLKGLGMDTISVDAAEDHEFPVHKTFLEQETILIENLANLASLPGPRFFFSCFPLSYHNADGSPVRAVAFIT